MKKFLLYLYAASLVIAVLVYWGSSPDKMEVRYVRQDMETTGFVSDNDIANQIWQENYDAGEVMLSPKQGKYIVAYIVVSIIICLIYIGMKEYE
jgi:hypothetical protein